MFLIEPTVNSTHSIKLIFSFQSQFKLTVNLNNNIDKKLHVRLKTLLFNCFLEFLFQNPSGNIHFIIRVSRQF